MKLAVISDIHGNLEALEAVLEDLARVGADACVSLGDNVGYGPDPEAVVTLLIDKKIPSVMGNHELALADAKYLAWFNSLARKSILLTEKELSVRNLDYCRGLPAALSLFDCLFVHGCPPDRILTYIFEASTVELSRAMERMKERLCFVGHTHLLELFGFDGAGLFKSALGPAKISLPAPTKFIVNAGSVGQPRDGDRSAKYVIWDSEERFLETRFIPYDHEKTVRKILAGGWPEQHARRLL
ncbi:MAG: metallophosphoesterase family protein [Pseudomonadota bacterium]